MNDFLWHAVLCDILLQFPAEKDVLGPMLWIKVKKLALLIGFPHILHREYIFKLEVVVVQTPE